MEHDTIVVLDYGKSASQTGHLIARGIRSGGVYSEIVPVDQFDNYMSINRDHVKGIVLPGAPDFVHQDTAPKPPGTVEYE